MQRIRKGLYLLNAAEPANCYLIEGPRGLTLFDTGHPLAAPLLIAELEGNAFALKDIEQIIISHSHFDHCGGAHDFLRRQRAKVLAHPEDIPAIQGREGQPASFGVRIKRLVRRFKYAYHPLGMVLPLEPGDSMRALPHWQVLHLPGHTPGSLALLNPSERILLCGDALGNRDDCLALPSAYNCHDYVQAQASIHKLALLDLEVIGCGHGPVVCAGAGLKVQRLLSAGSP